MSPLDGSFTVAVPESILEQFQYVKEIYSYSGRVAEGLGRRVARISDHKNTERTDLCIKLYAFNGITQRLGVLCRIPGSIRVQCPTHGRVQEEIPWAPAYARVTYRLEWRLCTLCQIMTQKAAAEILRMPTSTLSNLLHRVITRVRHGHKIRGLTTLGVDEISFCKGRKFATLVYDLDRARVLWVGSGKGRDTIDRFFNDWLSRGQKARVAWASCDMSPAYIGAITHPPVPIICETTSLMRLV